MKLTDREERAARDMADRLGRPHEDLIREGEALKSEGFRAAQRQAEGWQERSAAAAGSAGMTAGRYADPLADPDVMAADRRHQAQAELEAAE